MFEIRQKLSAMSVTRLPIIFKIKFNLRSCKKTEISPKSLEFLNRTFSCSVKENQSTDALLKKKSPGGSFYRQYLLNNSKYTNFISRSEFIETNTKTSAVLNQLHQEGQNNHSLNDQLSYHLDRELIHFNFQELCEVIFFILKFNNENINDPFWKNILQTVQNECLNRMPTYTFDEMIKLNDALLIYSRSLKLKTKLMYKLCRRSSTSHQITALFYFLLETKFLIPQEDVFKVQEKLEKIIPEINSVEAGIIAEGCLKSFSYLSNCEVYFGILMKAVEEMESINQVPFNSICKFARRFSSRNKSKGIPEFQEKLTDAALRFGPEHIIKLALSGENINYLNSGLRTVLMNEVKDHVKDLSTFYIGRVTEIGTKVNIRDEEFLKMTVEELQTNELTEKNRKHFLLILSNLTHYQIYPKNLLNLIFKQEFVDDILKEKISTQISWWQLYCSLEIEKPECLTAIDVPPKTRSKIYQKHRIKFINQHQKHYTFLRKMHDVLVELFGEKFINYCNPLPHYPMGLLIRFDKNSKPQQLPEGFVSFKNGFTIKALQDDHIWMFFTIVYFSDQIGLSKDILNFVFLTQLRQLNALGYTPLLAHDQWGKNRDNKEYLENLISAKLEECCKDYKDAILN